MTCYCAREATDGGTSEARDAAGFVVPSMASAPGARVSPSPRLVALPDGTRVWAHNSLESTILYHQLGVQRVYEQHGLTVQDGDCIFDVGANIGLYSVLLLRAYRRLRVFAFEPLLSSFHLLERNLAVYGGEAEVCTFNCALGRAPGIANGELDGPSFVATLRPGDVAAAARQDASALVWTDALLTDLGRAGQLSPRLVAWLRRGLHWPLTRWPCRVLATTLLVHARIRVGVWKKRRFRCQVRTLSEVLRTWDVPRVDLLKIDVEGSEWEVLAGVEPELWKRIRQVVVEVHDVTGRVEAVDQLLRQQGYQTAVDQEDWAVLALLGVASVYAWRTAG
jgi:31-O-methyltransferase